MRRMGDDCSSQHTHSRRSGDTIPSDLKAHFVQEGRETAGPRRPMRPEGHPRAVPDGELENSAARHRWQPLQLTYPNEAGYKIAVTGVSSLNHVVNVGMHGFNSKTPLDRCTEETIRHACLCCYK